jgi:acetylglutamate kinase
MPATGHERGRTVQDIIVFKCGGSSVNDLSEDFFDNIKALQHTGKKLVIVHGGGLDIEKMLEKLQLDYEFVDGLRKTTDEMMDIVEMVLSGNVNPALTRHFNASGIEAVGLSGSDLHLLTATPIDEAKYGQVGEVTGVNTKLIHALIEQNIVPVISPVAIDMTGKRFNVNADTAAGAVASALKAQQLVFVTDVDGILREGTLLEEVTTTDIEAMIADGTIYGGMIPKVKAAMKGLHGNVQEVMIVNGKESELKTTTTLAGTTICSVQEKARVG